LVFTRLCAWVLRRNHLTGQCSGCALALKGCRGEYKKRQAGAKEEGSKGWHKVCLTADAHLKDSLRGI
jgi:hypothetical protein